MNQNASRSFILVLSLLSLIATALLFPDLPDQIPLHWGITGEIDRYGDKRFVFLTGALPLLLLLLLIVIPKIDPRRENYLKHAGAFSITVVTLVLFLILLHWLVLLLSLGYPIDVLFFVRLSLGIVFVVLGSVMPRIRHNYLFGIRTPWTLADERVWKKTHRVGGPLFVIVGLVSAALAFVPSRIGFSASITMIVGSVVILFVYSYLEFRRLR